MVCILLDFIHVWERVWGRRWWIVIMVMVIWCCRIMIWSMGSAWGGFGITWDPKRQVYGYFVNLGGRTGSAGVLVETRKLCRNRVRGAPGRLKLILGARLKAGAQNSCFWFSKQGRGARQRLTCILGALIKSSAQNRVIWLPDFLSFGRGAG